MSDQLLDATELIRRLAAKKTSEEMLFWISELYGTIESLTAKNDRLRELLNYAVEWVSDRGYDDPETAPEWFLSALREAGDE